MPFWEDGFLFNQWRHLRQQQSKQMPWLVQAVNRQTGLAEARCAVWVNANGPALSPAAAPFGSVEFTPTLPEDVLADVIDLLLTTVQNLGNKQLIIKNYPAIYAPDQTARLAQVLLQKGFQITARYENSHLFVTSQPFTGGLALAARRRLRQAQEFGFQRVDWPMNRLDEALAFVGQSRARQGYPLTMPLDQLRQLFVDFPDAFRIMAVLDGQTIASLTVAIQVREDVLYNFLPVDNLDYRHLSPAILLTEGLYTYCQQTNTRLLDLGVSLNDDRTDKPSLLRFKRGLGAQSSGKLVFSWDG